MKKIYSIIAFGLGVIALSSCNDYLDKLPDERAELDSEAKIQQLLVSAYPAVGNNFIAETLSDNIDDNGRSYSPCLNVSEDLYRLEDSSEEGSETPYWLWQGYYNAVAVSNQAIEGIEGLGNPASMNGALAEAKLTRAYSMFMLAQTFCMAWNPEKADEFLGLPYPTEPEKGANSTYERGTLRELYEAIDKDIEEALPYIGDAESYYSVAKYHFNIKAAYAFAARFNLYYMKYDKAIKYANQVLGADPTAVMRNYEPYRTLGYVDFSNRWIRADEDANLMLLATYDVPRYLSTSPGRFAHNSKMANYETYWVDMPWGSGSSNNPIIYSNNLYGNTQRVFYPSYIEQFEYTDKVGGTGYPHGVSPVFTGDILILERAEAYLLTGQLEKALADMNTWIKTHCKEVVDAGTGQVTAPVPVLTVADIAAFVKGTDYAKRTPDGNRDRSFRKHMHPQGFTIDAEGSDQECMLQMLLHMKRIETVAYGLRFQDIKRYGIEHTHLLSGEDPVVFIRGDLRGAVQIPNTVIVAGIEANPRMTKEEIKTFVESTEAEYADAEDEEE